MSTVLAHERTRYEEVWTSVEQYGANSPGEMFLPVFLDLVGDARGTLLDAGCGSGKAAVALHREKFHVRLCDVTDAGLIPDAQGLPFHEACLWHDLKAVTQHFGHWSRSKADWVYCCDVLEHIPPQFTMLVIRNLIAVARRGVFLSVSLVPDQFGAWVGSALHQTVQPFTWWRDNVKELGTIVDARDLHHTAIFMVRPK